MLIIKQLSCVRHYRTLFKGLDYYLPAHRILHVIGPNGAGKTSLLRIIAGLMVPDEGTVEIAEVAAVLYIGHTLGLNENLTVWENLEIMQRISASSQDLVAVLQHMHLLRYRQAPLSLLSAGLKRRVALSQLLIRTASLWILDEPFTALDKSSVQLIMQLLANHIARGGSCVIASHQDLPLPDVQQLELGA
ncbi:MAG: cytochrome c biogenesis heme-transporting ATPase CcmA [Gammaproteobacteria bacterium]